MGKGKSVRVRAPDADGEGGSTPDGRRNNGDEAGIVQGTAGRIAQKRKPDPRVPVADIREFLTILSQTCNVRHAAEVSGVKLSTLYARRRARPAFAVEWRDALAIGYERLEEELLRLSLETLMGERPSLFEPGEAMRAGTGLPAKANGSPDVQLALMLLNKHRATVEGTASPNAHTRRATPEETDALLRKKLDGLAKRLRAVGK